MAALISSIERWLKPLATRAIAPVLLLIGDLPFADVVIGNVVVESLGDVVPDEALSRVPSFLETVAVRVARTCRVAGPTARLPPRY